jgi:hypothetical protein
LADVEIAVGAPQELEPGLEPEAGSELEPGIEPELEPDFLLPVETDVNWEVEALPEEIAEPTEPPAPAPAPGEDLVPAESAPQSKPRKPRAPKAGAKTSKRKPSTRRKTKEPAEAKED